MTNKQLLDLLHTLNTTEKLAQLTQLNPVCFGGDCITDLTGPDFGLRVSNEASIAIGSVLNCDNASDMIELQKKHLEQDPHHIPLIFMADIIHGFKTIFPIPLAMSCSFSPSNVEEAARIAAHESSVSGIHVTFSPMADLVRDPRWGRVMESCGEDPYLNGVLSAAAVTGYQGEDPSFPYKLASCVKHFAAYGMPEGGREYNTVDLSYGTLRDIYLPAYKAALDAGARLIMSSFNIVDRIPATANKVLMQDILRKEWDFSGVVISDFNSVGELIHHGVAKDGAVAAQKSMEAGIDIEMMSTHYLDHIPSLIEEDKLSIEHLDNAVLNVLNLKNDLGLFENPYKDASTEQEDSIHLSPEHRAKARRIAAESAVLLKNEYILPIDQNKKIGLAGPFACSPHVLGSWSAGSTTGISLYEGLLQSFSPDCICLAATEELGCSLDGISDIPPLNSESLLSLEECETVIVAVGEHQSDTGEGGSKAFLRLSHNQENLIQCLKSMGKKVVTLIFSGRPLEIAPILPYSDALMQAWFLGTESGNALADLLLGKVNPSGRLTMSFPYTTGQIPVYYNRYATGRPATAENAHTRYVSRYLDCPVSPFFSFGYGISYSEFKYTDFSISTTRPLTVSITVHNCSARTGIETVQLYIRHISSSVVRPIKELKGFKRIPLEPDESRTVTFPITREMLTYFGKDSYLFEPGNYELMIGKNAEDTISAIIYIDDTLWAV